jgi:hypothetical protein
MKPARNQRAQHCKGEGHPATDIQRPSSRFFRQENRVYKNQLIVGSFALAIANAAIAGPTVPLGTPLGVGLGTVLGSVLGGVPLGAVLPIASAGMLLVAAVSLVIGIHIVRRKHKG